MLHGEARCCSSFSVIKQSESSINYPLCSRTIGVSANVQSSYFSALTKNHSIHSPHRCRKANHYFEAVQLSVSHTGCYTFISKSDVNLVGYVYVHSFDLSNPNANLFVHYDGNENSAQFNFTVQLETASEYVLVVSTYLSNEIGSFSITASGPNTIDFSRIGKAPSNDSSLCPAWP